MVWGLKIPTISERESLCMAVAAVVRCLGGSSSSCKDFPDDVLLVVVGLIHCKDQVAMTQVIDSKLHLLYVLVEVIRDESLLWLLTVQLPDIGSQMDDELALGSTLCLGPQS